eukprot:CAMPEP_0170472010 /NCGR_PEP_ID=MMETSP0123-20130129/14115_1 /TAXON_ID=182087 /ORGANISM="Favella ehrenbergii, Strain Fehren 1" /LENGTH=64 /DNA_ID=CAMNT_0010740001 /DNA_START=94 /DNA_END=288 /DNA_ORIENTATION=-
MATQPNKFNTCCQFVINAVMSVLFGIYAFDNPDDGVKCYTQDVHGETQASEIEPTDGEYTDVAK